MLPGPVKYDYRFEFFGNLITPHCFNACKADENKYKFNFLKISITPHDITLRRENDLPDI